MTKAYTKHNYKHHKHNYTNKDINSNKHQEGYDNNSDKEQNKENKSVWSFVRPTKEEYYLEIALAVSKRSTCLKRHYGAVIVKDDEIISTGYNGASRDVINCCDKGNCPRIKIKHNSGNYADCPAVHAEQNAIISAARRDMIGATIYLSGEEYDLEKNQIKIIKNSTPCPICERMIKNAGIVKIVSKDGIREL